MYKRITNLIKKPKRIIPVLANRNILNFLPTELLIKIRYQDKIGKKLNLHRPTTFNEKLQWLKLFVKNDFHTVVLCQENGEVKFRV